MKAVYVKYQVDPSFAETNAENIRKVMSDLRATGSDGVRYQSFRQSDGVTFVHSCARPGFGYRKGPHVLVRASMLAPATGLEPMTKRLTVARSTN